MFDTFPSLETNTNALWSLLLFAGYITIGETTIGKNGLPYGPVSIPNKEIDIVTKNRKKKQKKKK